MTKTAKQILTSLDKGEYLDLGGVDQALKELEAIHQQEIAKARIEELDHLYDHYSPYRPILDNDTQRSVRRYASGRIAELSQTLKEHKE